MHYLGSAYPAILGHIPETGLRRNCSSRSLSGTIFTPSTPFNRVIGSGMYGMLCSAAPGAGLDNLLVSLTVKIVHRKKLPVTCGLGSIGYRPA